MRKPGCSDVKPIGYNGAYFLLQTFMTAAHIVGVNTTYCAASGATFVGEQVPPNSVGICLRVEKCIGWCCQLSLRLSHYKFS